MNARKSVSGKSGKVAEGQSASTVSPLQPMAGVGHNLPPRHEAFAMALDDVHAEAINFLDGAAIETQGQADAIGVIIAKAKAIKRDADAARKEDKEPHLEAGRKVDADYKPVTDKADTVIKAATAPLTAWLLKVEAEQAEQARIAREEAARATQEAIEAQRAASGNLAATEAAQALQKDADQAVRFAAKAEKQSAHVSGMDRAIGLRSHRVVTVTDYHALINWIAKNDKPALQAFMDEYARKAPAGLPGVLIETERKVA